MSLNFTVIGCSGTHPAHGRVCSSYLLDDGRTRAVLDLGNGALAKLTTVLDLADLDAVVISHLHPDHFVDVVGLSYALRFHPDGPLSVLAYGPPGLGEMLTRHLDLDSRERFREVIQIAEVEPSDRWQLGSLQVATMPSHHPAAAMSVRVEGGGAVVAYSGDSGGSDELVACAQEADLFACDATWSAAGGPYPDGLHLTGEGAGRHAARARARQLLVTHISPWEDRRRIATEAAAAYGGPTLLADDLQEYTL